jgi:hypothetical protein
MVVAMGARLVKFLCVEGASHSHATRGFGSYPKLREREGRAKVGAPGRVCVCVVANPLCQFEHV